MFYASRVIMLGSLFSITFMFMLYNSFYIYTVIQELFPR